MLIHFRQHAIHMRVISWNVNGLRAALRKGISAYFTNLNPDLIMLQEIRSVESQLPQGWSPPSWHVTLHSAQKPGYSGVATLSCQPHIALSTGKGGNTDPQDTEGRILVCELGDLICINTYLPSGSNSDVRQEFKETWMDEWRTWLQSYVGEKRPVIVCGDLNIAHTEDDIWNPKGNANNSGFLPQERAWFENLLSDGWIDAFRHHAGDGVKTYSWWSNRGQARKNDHGWRIDYFLLNPVAAQHLVGCSIVRQGGLDISDHAPVVLDLDL